MLYYTRYSTQKFEILNKYQVFLTKEMVEDAINAPDTVEKKGKYYFATKDTVRAVYRKENEGIKIITFYPIKL